MADDKVLLAHKELMKKEKSVSVGKSLGRTFSKTGMTRGDKIRAEKYVKKMEQEEAGNADSAGTGGEATTAEASSPQDVVDQVIEGVVSGDSTSATDKSITEGGNMLKVFIGTVVIGIAIAMASMLLGSAKDEIVVSSPLTSMPKADEKKGFLERFSGR